MRWTDRRLASADLGRGANHTPPESVIPIQMHSPYIIQDIQIQIEIEHAQQTERNFDCRFSNNAGGSNRLQKEESAMRLWLSLLAFVLLSTCIQAKTSGPSLTVAWDDYPPYQIKVDGEFPGIDIEYIRKLAAQAGYAVKFVKMPWSRQLLSLEDGSIDIALSASMSSDRAGYAVWTVPYRPERAALMAIEKKAKRVPSLRSLVNTSSKIGVIRNSSFPGEFETLVAEKDILKNIHFTSTSLSALLMMRAGQISHVLDDPTTIEHLAKSKPGPKIKVVLEVMNSEAMLMLSKQTLKRHPTVVGDLNAAIAYLHKNHTLRRIYARYGTEL